MAKYRTRFNDKARAGGVAKRNALKAKRQKQFERAGADPEQAAEQAEKAHKQHEAAKPESEARKRVRMAMQFPEKANAAKKKRLEKYIDRQVRKDEKEDLLRKLTKSQQQVDTSNLQSLGGLGQGLKKHSEIDGEKSSGDEEEDDEEEEVEEVDLPAPKKRASTPTQAEPKKPSFADLESESESESESGSDSGSDSGANSGSGESASEGSEESASEDESASDEDTPQPQSEPKKSLFIDHRAQAGTGFGFNNLPNKNKPKKVSWKERLGFTAADELLDKTNEDESEDDSEDESEDDNEDESEDESEDDDQEEVSEAGSDEEEEDDDDEDEEESEGEDDSDEEEEDEEEEEEEEADEEEGTSGQQFMEWADSMDPNAYVSQPTPQPKNYVHSHRALESEQAVSAEDSQKSRPGWVERMPLEPALVERSEDVNASRTQLPAVASEQQIMDAINHFDSVVVTGATGSGKTTQIPQFLFENGYTSYGMVGVTQPRRVAAVSMAKRIGHELCGACDVGYQIRFDAKVGKNTKIKLMTDGVLLKELSSDLLLSKYSVVVVDEAHERSVNTDILIGLLSRVVRLRRKTYDEDNSQLKPLKLVVMSATLRVSDFAENARLFSASPPVVNVESRQFPVTNHFSRRTATDYVEEAVKKTKRIHEKLPKGGILIFLTGKDDIQRAIRELKPSEYKNPQVEERKSVRVNPGTSTIEEEAVEVQMDDEDIVNSDIESGQENSEEEEESDVEIDDEDKDEEHDQKHLHVLPLYSLLSTEDQLKVFEPVPKNHRLCVVATNVAETSLTIPGIRYVVDCGRAKMRVYDARTGIQKYAVKWVSQASADQRSGRAGRTGPGHCYRLYSSAMFERAFPEFGEPEIARMPVEGLVLQMKAMGISNVANFPFPSPVPQNLLDAGIKVLQNLGALNTKEEITSFGEQMSLFPLHPRQAKMLLIGNQHGCLPFVTALVAALSVQDVILPPENIKKSDIVDQSNLHQGPPILDNQADVLQLLSACAAYSWTPNTQLCSQLRLRPKAMSEIASLREQLAKLVATTLKSEATQTLTEYLSKPLEVPTALQITVLKQIVAAGYIDLVAARQAMFDTAAIEKTSRLVSRQPYVTVQPGPVVYIHPTTIMQTAPDFVVYSTLTASDNSDKVRIRPLTSITPAQLSALAAKTPLVTYSKPLGGAYAPKVIDATKREAWVVPRFGAALGSGGMGWDLPPKKVVQIRKNGQWVQL